MSLTSRGTVFVVIALVLGSVAMAAVLWNRFPHLGWFRWPARLSLIILCQFTAVALAAVLLNDTDRFYNSWSELVGDHQGRLSTVHPQQPSFADALNRQLLLQHHTVGSALVTAQIPQAGSKLSHAALVYLPAAYFDPAYANRDFPIIELLDGFPGSPQTWVGPLHIQHTADAEIATGRAVPFIAVMPQQNFLPANEDAQCLDVPSGPQVESTLIDSVRETMLADFRVSPDRRSWAVMGYSTGGYCALKIALQRPDDFSSAVSILGNTRPYRDAEIDPAFRRDPGLEEANDPIWLLAHRPQPDVAILLASSGGDPATLRAAQVFAGAARSPLRVDTLSAAPGGHNFQTFRLYEPIAFDWLSGQLRPPLAASATISAPAPHRSPGPHSSSAPTPPDR